ncbi:MAG: hypothetical protein R3208_04230 [Ketobacteraceae bacterium]|nr:hypothetical protein [Ketobacteraceae bacterium]
MTGTTKYLALLVAAGLCGCSTFYYGYSKAEWESLTRLEQEQAKQAYKEVRYDHQQNVYGNPPEDASNAFIDRALRTRGSHRY